MSESHSGTIAQSESDPTSKAPNSETWTSAQFQDLDPSLYAPSPEDLAFLKSQTGLEDEEVLKQHVLEVQAEAWKVHNIVYRSSDRSDIARECSFEGYKICLHQIVWLHNVRYLRYSAL